MVTGDSSTEVPSRVVTATALGSYSLWGSFVNAKPWSAGWIHGNSKGQAMQAEAGGSKWTKTLAFLKGGDDSLTAFKGHARDAYNLIGVGVQQTGSRGQRFRPHFAGKASKCSGDGGPVRNRGPPEYASQRPWISRVRFGTMQRPRGEQRGGKEAMHVLKTRFMSHIRVEHTVYTQLRVINYC